MLKPTVEVRDSGGVLVAEFWDCLRLDPEPVRALAAHFEAHRGRGGRADLIADLNGIEFAGSSALSGFLTLQRLSRRGGGRVVFCNVEPSVREVFRVSRMESLFGFAADLPAALALLATGSDDPGAGQAPTSPPPPPRSTPPPLRPRRRSS